MISQVARTTVGNRGIPYLATVASMTLILLMAANTAFADFPRLGALYAGDGFLPRPLTDKGCRLVYSRGIVALTLIPCLLILVFKASVMALIPLYAIGVFRSFTLSQAGMARSWWRVGQPKPGGRSWIRARHYNTCCSLSVCSHRTTASRARCGHTQH